MPFVYNGSLTVVEGVGVNTNQLTGERVWNFKKSLVDGTYPPVISELTPWFNPSEGTILYKFKTLATMETQAANFLLNLYTASDSQIILSTTNTRQLVYTVINGVPVASLTSGTAEYSTTYSVAMTYKLNDFRLCVNGGTIFADASGSVPYFNTSSTVLKLGSRQDGQFPLTHSPVEFRYYNVALSNAQLVSITQ